MARMTAGIWVNAPPEVVFRIIQAPPRPLLPFGAPRLTVLNPGAINALYRWEFRRLGFIFRLDSRVTESVPARRLAFRGTVGWEMEAQANIIPEGEGARISFQMGYRFPTPLRWLIPGALIRLGVWHGMNQVKAMSEELAEAIALDEARRGS